MALRKPIDRVFVRVNPVIEEARKIREKCEQFIKGTKSLTVGRR